MHAHVHHNLLSLLLELQSPCLLAHPSRPHSKPIPASLVLFPFLLLEEAMLSSVTKYSLGTQFMYGLLRDLALGLDLPPGLRVPRQISWLQCMPSVHWALSVCSSVTKYSLGTQPSCAVPAAATECILYAKPRLLCESGVRSTSSNR